MKREKLIFLTNDDSYRSKGFAAAIQIARQFGRVIAIAPDAPQSGMSQAITIYNPLYLRKVREEEGVLVYSLNGTPVDCVKMAFDHLFRDEKVDLVISGINHGSNAAVNVLYSGTMGAAIEAAFYNIPSIGLSLTDHDLDADFEGAIKYGTQIVESVLRGDMPQPLCLNVNVPNIPCSDIKGIRLSRQTRGYWREEFYKRTDPHGRDYFWLTGAFSNAEPTAEDTDEWALANGYVSIVPVQVDLTAYTQMAQLSKYF
ncbi:MAG: 5'/3'-nucleotidase SurE [Alistipes sp.]|nr:5'/3'-nucleotidase SurE [Alistipes sp.]